jgi:hypothetical protein
VGPTQLILNTCIISSAVVVSKSHASYPFVPTTPALLTTTSSRRPRVVIALAHASIAASSPTSTPSLTITRPSLERSSARSASLASTPRLDDVFAREQRFTELEPDPAIGARDGDARALDRAPRDVRRRGRHRGARRTARRARAARRRRRRREDARGGARHTADVFDAIAGARRAS